jgi:hypothetical protein
MRRPRIADFPADNLYLSTGGYPVLVETKLWRNPQARREVVSQALDYVKDLVNRDFAWLAERWIEHARSRGLLQLAPGDGPMLNVKKETPLAGRRAADAIGGGVHQLLKEIFYYRLRRSGTSASRATRSSNRGSACKARPARTA